MSETLLVADKVTRRFGGLAAVSNVTLELRRGELHAVLGPNGAGKSTLINLLSGDLPVSSGAIRLRNQEVTTLPMHERSRLGIGRSYQKTNIFPNFTARENCRLAAQSRDPRSARIFSDARRLATDVANEVLALVRLNKRANAIAAALSHGEQRQLEIAMVLATRPDVLLLDEPLAGMGAEESAGIAQLIKQLATDHAVMLVEHDLDTVFAIADIVTVMANGQILESGSPDRIRKSTAVRDAYLVDSHV